MPSTLISVVKATLEENAEYPNFPAQGHPRGECQVPEYGRPTRQVPLPERPHVQSSAPVIIPPSHFPLPKGEERRAWDRYQACLRIMDSCEVGVETGIGESSENNRTLCDLAE